MTDTPLFDLLYGDAMQDAPKPEQASGSLQRPGSAATCDWLTTLNGKETCGKPATHIRKGGANLSYCYEHACKLSAYTVLEMLPPQNDKLRDGAPETPPAN
jgi:hypothetical protein